MQQLIIGFLLLAIILLGGWLIYFYNKMTNQRIVAEERQEWLIHYLQKRNELPGEGQELAANQYQIAELEENIAVCRYLHNEAVSIYNNTLAVFPGKAAGLILGLNKLDEDGRLSER